MSGDGDSVGSDKRLHYWGAMTICSAISLGSICAETKASRTDEDKFLISVGAIVMSLGTVYSVLIVRKTNAQIYEFPVSLLCLVFWAVGLGVLFHNTSYALDVANIYYFSWGALISAVLLFTWYLKAAFEIDVGGRMAQRGYRFTVWSVLCASSVIVMSASTDKYRADNCGSLTSSSCKRTALGVGLGASSTILALAMLAFLCCKRNSLIVEGIMSFLICVAFAISVGFITSPTGPASGIGNLFYSTWIAFIASVLLLLDCISEFRSGRENQPEEQDSAKVSPCVANGPRIEIKELEDNV